ncbi:hypothetical protein ACA910_000649 [Epithemia clementina (nom. ined.)]
MANNDGTSPSRSIDTESELFLERSEDAPDLTNRYRLWIHVANLPRHGLLRGRNPSTYAVVTCAAPTTNDDDRHFNHDNSTSGMVTSPVVQLGQTEVVPHCCSPQYAEAFYLNYRFGSKCFFFVHIFLAPQSQSDDRKISFGTARFEVGDIIGSPHHWRARSLRQGGVVFSRLEPIVNRSLSDDRGVDVTSVKYLRIRMSAHGLEIANKRPSLLSGSVFNSLPDLVVEISRRADQVCRLTWITVFRSQPVRNTVTPKWDPGTISLDCLCQGDIEQHIRVSVLVIRPTKPAKMIAFCETTVRFLMQAAEFRQNMDLATARDKLRSFDASAISEESSEFLLQQCPNRPRDVGRLTVLEADIVTLDETGNFSEDFDWQVKEAASTRSIKLASLPTSQKLVSRPAMEQPLEQPKEQSFEPRQTFQELLLQNRCQFNFCVAIDFTSSNGDVINDQSSLHYQSDSLNDYEESILAIGQAIKEYANGQSCSVWGFGAKFGDGVVQHFFQCGDNPRVQEVGNILEAYRSVIHSGFTMSGPTVFLKVIQAAAVQAKKHHETMDQNEIIKYTILLIITDGIMDDFDETRRKIEAYSEMPLSIIFVGVGHSDFSTLQHLCQICPTNTTCIEFRSQESPSEFALGALANLPYQVSSYAQRRR